MFCGPRASEGVGKPIVLSAEPNRLGPIIMLDLIISINTCHPKTIIVSRSAVLDEEEASLRIRKHPDVVASHLRPPYSGNEQVSKEFEIRNVEVVEVRWRGHRNIFVEAVMICSDTGVPGIPPVRGGVKRYFHCCVLDQEGHAVAKLKSLEPPLDVVPKRLVQINGVGELCRASFRGEDPVDEQTSSEEDIAGVE